MLRTVWICAALVLAAAPANAAEKMTKETVDVAGRTRTYYLLVPERAKKAAPAPMIVLLHGSGRDGRSLLEKWEPLAKKEGIILLGPDASMRDALHEQGFAPQLTEIRGHTHWYYDRAPAINKEAWAFLRQHVLPDDAR